MKFRFPKKVIIGDSEFFVKYNKKGVDGEFSYAKDGKPAFIIIGIRDIECNPIGVLNVIIHELKEIIQIEQASRYMRIDDHSYEFHYTHKEHTDLCARLAQNLMKFIK